MKRATAYMSNNKFIVHPDSLTTVGVGFATEPFIKIDSPFIASEVSNSIKKALSAAVIGVPHPTDWNAQAESYHYNMGLNSKRIHKDFSCCSIQQDESFFYFTPTKNLGSKNGYTHIEEQKIKVEISSSSENIYNALLQAMKISKESVED